MKSLFLCILSCLVLNACTGILKTSPYIAYKKKLEQAGLLETALGQQWVSAGELALKDPIQKLNYPFRDEIFFRKEEPMALAYQIAYSKTDQLSIAIKSKDGEKAGVFADLILNGASKESLQARDTSFTFEDSEDQLLLLRLQPQLLADAYVSVEIIAQSKLGFPVKNASNKSIQSFWGDGRDAGKRKHEGIDIFASRGTPVLAVEDGTISRVQETPIGGKVVWHRLGLLGQHIYYAHLDSQLVEEGQKVNRGDTLGLIGNTGNARSTAPHLHFGIYTSGGAIDPLNYVWIRDTVPDKLKADISWLGKEIRLEKNNEILPAKILSISTDQILVSSFTGKREEIKKIQELSPVKKSFQLPDSALMYNHPASGATPIARFTKQKDYQILGFSKGAVYLEQENLKAWIGLKNNF